MDKETLRMQMLSGIITESEYKAKLQENEEKELTYNDFVRMVRDDMMAGVAPDEYPSDEQIKNRAKVYYNEYLQGASVDDLFETKSKDSLNEHYVAGGIVGIGAINQIPSRVKADYEDAFEYFLSQKYSLNEIEEVEEALDSKIANDPNFKKLASYFKQNPDEAKDVKDELSSLKEAYKDKGKYYVEDAYGNKKEVPFKEYLKDKLLAIGLPAAALGLVGALMAGPLGAMDPGSILQAVGIAAGIGGAAGAALDYGKPTSIKETEVEELDLYEAESPTKEEIAAFEAAVEQLMDMTGMSLEDATMAIGRAANAKTK